jgi:predicted RNase H-like HicB family nuclease
MVQPGLGEIIAMSELIFLVEEAPEGGYTARALGESIFSEGEGLEELRANIRDAVRCHFADGKAPQIIRLHFVREEILTA